MNNLFWFDCETTGLDENRNDIIQLAGIPYINQVEQKSFNEFCQPIHWNNIDPYAVKVHGITPAKMKTFQTQEQFLDKFITYVESFGVKFVLAGYNVDFDRRFLSALFTRHGRSTDFIRMFELDAHDTYKRAKDLGKGKLGTINLKLETLCKANHIEIIAHDALSDISGTVILDGILAGMQGESTDVYCPVVSPGQITISKKLPEPAHLHIHSQYSLLDGTLTPEDWLKFCKEKDIPAISFVDQASGASLYRAIRSEDVNCIPGLGLYVKGKSDEVFTFNAWATSNQGYYNLIKLASLSHETVYEVDKKEYPYVTLDQIEQYREGLKFGTACVNGLIGTAVRKGDADLARHRLSRLMERFGDDLHVEFMPVDITYKYDTKTGFKKVRENILVTECNLQKAYNVFLAGVVDDLGVKCLPTNGACFIDPDDKVIQDCLRKNGNKDGSYYYESYHFKDSDQMYRELKVHLGDWLTEEKYEEWVNNSLEIAEQAKSIKIEFEPHLPTIDIPEHIKNTADDYNEQVYLYMMERIEKHGRWNDTPEYRERFEMEIDVIKDNKAMSFIPYFLTYDDISEYARDAGYLQNIARGSAGGSLLSYYLKIIHVDPVKHNLPFERFLSHARINAGSWPDIDMDISKTARPYVMAYLKDKYGAGFAQVATYSTMKTKNAIKDAMFALYGRNRNDIEIKTVCDTIPDSPQGTAESDFLYGYTDKEEIYHKGQLEQNEMLQTFFSIYPDVDKMVSRMIGIVRGWSRHASAFAITTIDLGASRIPLLRMYDKGMDDWINVTAFAAEMVESSGVCKSDLLGLKCLSAVTECMDLVKDKVDYLASDEAGMSLIYRLPEDEAVYVDFYKRKTDSAFQYNSPTIKGCLQEFAPCKRPDLMVLTAIKRPGAMDYEVEPGLTADQLYVDVRNGKREMKLAHPDLKPYLGSTFGVCVYQEQIMAILAGLCGYTVEETDVIRSAIAKKKHKVMLAAFDRIREATKARGWTSEQTESICDTILAFSRYSFNKSHSYAYAELGYITMYLKHHHPTEWWTAVLNNEDNEDKLRGFISLLGDRINPPSIKKPTGQFMASGDKIVAPLSVIKRVGPKSYDNLCEAGPFDSLADFVSKVDHRKVNIGVVGQLIKARAADELMDLTLPYPEARQKLMDEYRTLRPTIKTAWKPELSDFDPLSMFLMEKDVNKSFNKSLLNDKGIYKYVTTAKPEFSATNKRGIPFLFKGTPILNGEIVANGLLQKEYEDTIGMVLLFEGSSVKKGISKRGKPYVFTKSILTDGFTNIEATHWDNERAYSFPLNSLVFVKGKLSEGWKTNVCITIYEIEKI